MEEPQSILTDTFDRTHSYLRISLTERCNLRCYYCMPEYGVPLMPRPDLMNSEELFEIAKIFVEAGVNKIRLTGGEPLVRKDFPEIVSSLATLPITLSITSNGVSIDRHMEILQKHKIQTINLSLDTLVAAKFKKITFRDYFDKVYTNIFRLMDADFKVKINMVLMKGVNDDEIIDFIQFTKNHAVNVRFIEFMPFDGNNWNRKKTVSLKEILSRIKTTFAKEDIIKLPDAPSDTAKNYKIAGYKGEFGVISTVTNPFCDTCNRIRLTANGRIKNCLFSPTESDLLTPFREGRDIRLIIQKAMKNKFAMRGGLNTPQQFNDLNEHSENRSMIRIGG